MNPPVRGLEYSAAVCTLSKRDGVRRAVVTVVFIFRSNQSWMGACWFAPTFRPILPVQRPDKGKERRRVRHQTKAMPPLSLRGRNTR
jgi:hypothetical protein